MKIACVTAPERGGTDQLLADLAAHMQAKGKRLAGIVKDLGHITEFENGCDMKVRVLPDGPVIKITQDLGKGSDACRLDPGALVRAVACVQGGTFDNVDLFVLNKFGPEEAAGRGFCSVIGTALEHDIPVLVGLGGASKAAFATFTDGLALTLSPDIPAILAWLEGDAT